MPVHSCECNANLADCVCMRLQAMISEDTITTTISRSFSQHNAAATIYLIGPMSLIHVFRVYRTINDSSKSAVYRKIILIVVLLSQSTVMVVIRYDAIHGIQHYIFTGVTFTLLIVYHNTITGSCPKGYDEFIITQKSRISFLSVTSMMIFGIVQISHLNIHTDNLMWNLVCVLEVMAVILLGSLDMIDTYYFGVLINNH